MKVIFLDFDGVTHPVGCEEILEFCFLPNIQNTIKTYLGEWKIVISSGWKNLYSTSFLKSFFSSDIKKHIYGVTPSIPFDNLSYAKNRGKEIDKFLFDHKVEKYIIIDDKPQFLESSHLKFTIVPMSNKGFTDECRNDFLLLIKSIGE